MAVIAFWSNEEKETGQTMSMLALSTYMAIEHTYKILNVSTNFRDTTIEDSYWNNKKTESLFKEIKQNEQVAFESGIEGLVKVINSNRTTPNIIANYAKVVFKDNRLDILETPKTTNFEEYKKICKIYPEILQLANRNYDLVFVDISTKMPQEDKIKILQMADIIVINMTQRLKTIDGFIELRKNNDFFKKNNIIINIGRYDKFSKYNVKNVTRYLREKQDISAVPYNTLFFESCSEGKIAEFFLKLRRLEPDDRNMIFIEEISRMSKYLQLKIKEVQMKG